MIAGAIQPSWMYGNYAREAAMAEHPAAWRGLAGIWRPSMGNQGLLLRDWSNNGNHGTPVNGPTYVAGRDGLAMSCDGVNQYVDISIAAPEVGVSEGCISAWIRLDAGATSDGTNNMIVEIGKSVDSNTVIRLSHLTGTGIVMRYRVGGTNYDAVISDLTGFEGNWVHIVGKWDAGNVYIYKNGSLIDSDSRGTDTSGLDIAAIGTIAQNAISTGQGHPYKGQLDDIRIYNRALSASEIMRMYLGDFDPLQLRQRRVSYSVPEDEEVIAPRGIHATVRVAPRLEAHFRVSPRLEGKTEVEGRLAGDVVIVSNN